MPNKSYKLQILCDHIIKTLNLIHMKKHLHITDSQKLPHFPTKSSLIDFILNDPKFCDTQGLEEIRKGQMYVCRTTVSKAINVLIEDGRIYKGDAGYEIVPDYHKRFEKFPILTVAKRINISIGIPENILFLSVASGATASVADFLSAIFHRGDILFIPLGNTIMCVEVLPKEIIDKGNDFEKQDPLHFRQRIESALRLFDCEYPQFHYGLAYECGSTIHLDPYFRQKLKYMAKDIYETSIDSQIIGETQDTIFRKSLEAYGLTERIAEKEQQDLDAEKAARQEELDFFYDPLYDDGQLDSLSQNFTPCTKRIKQALKHKSPLSRKEIVTMLEAEGYTRRRIYRALRQLAETGVISRGKQVEFLSQTSEQQTGTTASPVENK